MPPVPRSDEQEQKHKDIFHSWLAECEKLQERLIEAMLKEIEEG